MLHQANLCTVQLLFYDMPHFPLWNFRANQTRANSGRVEKLKISACERWPGEPQGWHWSIVGEAGRLWYLGHRWASVGSERVQRVLGAPNSSFWKTSEPARPGSSSWAQRAELDPERRAGPSAPSWRAGFSSARWTRLGKPSPQLDAVSESACVQSHRCRI